MHYVVIEPHPDDAYLSLGWHLEVIWRGHERTIISVFADVKREREAREYAAAIGARSVCLGLAESRMREEPTRKPVAELVAFVGQMRAVEGHMTKYVFPLGLQHPDHIAVSLSRCPGALRYLDTPYQQKQKLSEILQSKVQGMSVYSLCYPGARKWKHIPVFQSQAKFFHFNDMKAMKLPETILYYPEEVIDE